MKRKIILALMVLVLPVVVRAEKPTFIDTIKNTECNRSYTWNDYISQPKECVGDECTDITVIGGSCANDNYALIGDMCFRAVRTTYTDGVKIMYWGKATDGKCGSTKENMTSQFGTPSYYPMNQSVAYMYQSGSGSSRKNMLGETNSAAYNTSSALKTNIDKFYKDNLTDYANYFEDAIYCNSLRYSTSSYSSSYSYGATGGSGSSRYYNEIISDNELRCRQEDSYTVSNTDGNSALKYPIATISYHEFMLASDAYDIWIPSELWTMSPSMFYIYGSGGSGSYNGNIAMKTTKVNYSSGYPYLGIATTSPYSTYSYLPVVSANKDVLVLAGTGVQNDPYVLGFPEPEPTGVKRQVHTKIVWDDKGNEDNTRPSSVIIKIFVNGVEKFKKTVTAEDGWVFDAEIELASANDEVKFSVEQNEVEGYTLSIDQLASNQFVITNTHKPEVKGVEENPKTGIFNYLWILPIIAVIGFIVYKELIKETLFKSN